MRVRPAIAMQPPPRFGSREVLVVPHQRPREDGFQQKHAITTTQDQGHDQAYDGADEPEQPGNIHIPSRMTNMTWSTLSHRVLTDSTCSSRRSGASYFKDEYNQLAEKHGIRRMAAASSDDDNKTKVTTKSHQHGWIARKLFRRLTSTYTLKAKATYKTLTRKKSLAGIPLLSEGAPKNIIKGKTLEEIGRLGGLGTLVLPHDFAVDNLTLPTCLSATATYLCQHGCNAPGIFRVSGQSTTINALYDFYDHQFYHAGSPSKVEETVGSGLLPTNIEHTIPDVASLFKKILIGLPGGLLGIVELFEVIRDILLNMAPDPELSSLENTLLRAKLIALAVLSVTSTYRVYLIQAVLGLAAYFGSEAERAEAECAATDDQGQRHQPKSELMGYQSLGVVLGPLLLGDLTDKVDVSKCESQEAAPRTSTDSMKRSKKQKRNSAQNKLEKDATLSAHVDRAKLTASIMQLLLLIWKDVVSQFREINGAMSASWQTRGSSQIKTIPSRAGSRLILNSEEDMLFPDVLSGRKLPDEFTGGAVVKRKVRISSRSPMSHGAIKVSEDDQRPQQTWQPAADEEHHDESPKCANVIEAMERSFEQPIEPDRTVSEGEPETSTEDIDRFNLDKRTNSDIAMDKMAMGTIRSSPEDAPISTSPKGSASQASLIGTPRGRGRQRSSSDAPETAFKVVHLQNISQTLPPTPRRLQPFLDKPLPPIGDYQRAEISPRTSEDDAAGTLRSVLHQGPSRRPEEIPSFPSRDPSPRALFPTRHASPNSSFSPRQSSLPTEAPLPMRSLETYDSLAEYRAQSDAYMPLPNGPYSRKASDAQVNEDELPPAGEKRNSVKFLAQQFAEASRANRKEEEVVKDSLVPTVYAYIKPIPSPMSPLEELFTSFPSRTPSPEKESLIPKPVHTVGRGRKSVSRSPSPPKQTTPRSSQGKRPSVYNIVPDQDAVIVKRNTLMLSESSVSAKRDLSSVRPEVVPSSTVQYLSTRHLSVTSTESHRLPSPTLEEPLMEHHIPKRVTTPARSNSPNRSSSPSRLNRSPSTNDPTRTRTNSYLDASDNLKALGRHGSMNATLYAEICRLQRMLEQKDEEVLAARRGLDAVRDTYKERGFADEGKGKGSWNKGKLDDEVRVAREETGLWKRRAQLAEEQSKGVSRLAGVVAEVGDGGIEEVVRERKDSGTGMMGENGSADSEGND
ncbi:hypothetical protein OEA41_010010 [Lepraria neglecta]|uniref:Rho-GAP domain-containing protein n=1 Tax=Lepraria neglecta TaxID=209136 RepID=A0AAE0DF61_9LECA|nr:hypothetical protein OEA41_010010 [Lepraria neglecta]